MRQAPFALKVALCMAFVLGGHSVQSNRKCHEQCECPRTSRDGLLVTCKNLALTRLPEKLPRDTAELQLGGNNFGQLRGSFFSNQYLPKLKILDLSNCSIDMIEKNVFQNLTNLYMLDLSNNGLTSVQPYAFTGLHKLKILNMHNNHLKHIQEHTFHGLNLTFLNLGNNTELATVHSKAFEASHIHELIIYSCHLVTLPGTLLKPLSASLRRFSLYRNTLPLLIPTTLFEGLALERLDLSYNQISNWNFTQFVRSNVIQFMGNFIGNKSESIIRNIIDCESLGIANTGLQQFRIDMESASVSSIKQLDLSDNEMYHLESETFKQFQSLEILLLANNSLRTIPDKFGEIFSRLTRLDVSANPFHCNCELLWLKRWLTKNKSKLRMRATCIVAGHRIPIINIDDKSFRCLAPHIIHMSSDVAANGSEVIFNCSARGDPAPEVTWYAPGTVPITTSQSTAIQKTVTVTVFTANSQSVIGDYICVARNSEGSERGVLTIHTHPLKVKHPLEVPPGVGASTVSSTQQCFNRSILILAVVITCVLTIAMTALVMHMRDWARKRKERLQCILGELRDRKVVSFTLLDDSVSVTVDESEQNNRNDSAAAASTETMGSSKEKPKNKSLTNSNIGISLLRGHEGYYSLDEQGI